MPRKSNSRGRSAPKYRHHKLTGRAVVTISGKDVYLGKFDSPDSHEMYRKLISGIAVTEVKRDVYPAEDDAVTVAQLAVSYAKHAKAYYQKNGEPTAEWAICQRVLRELRKQFGPTDATLFGPLRYKEFRQTFIDSGLKRSTINHYCWHVRKMFQLAGENEVVAMSYFRDLDSVQNLQPGRSSAVEPEDVMPVDSEILKATLPELKQVFQDMVNLQLLTGMRPGEIRKLRPCDIDRSVEVWKYVPATHKNQHKKSRKAKQRTIWIGPKAQALLLPYLVRDELIFCFSPIEHDTRATSLQFTKDAYTRAIGRAALRAFPYPKGTKGVKLREKLWRAKYCWSPNQLRHSAATAARKYGGLETAQQVLGHTQKTTTENAYAEIDSELAVEFAKKHG